MRIHGKYITIFVVLLIILISLAIKAWGGFIELEPYV